MLNKFLLIGLGGSGGKTLRYTWRELERRLEATGWRDGVPEAWQFLHIDVTQNTDVVESDVPADIGSAADYVGLADDQHDYADYDAALVRRGPLDAIAGWRVDPAAVDIRPPYKGAGQRRLVGRVVTVSEIAQVGKAIQDAISTLGEKDVTSKLDALNAHLGAQQDANSDPVTPVVISSLAGGSGSGMFLDVIELLKRRAGEHPWLDSSLVTILYAADAFRHLSPQEGRGIQANSLAALSELLSAFEHEGDVSSREHKLLAPGGGTKTIVGRRTGDINFIVGSKNGDLQFSNGADVYRAIGKALSAFMANDTVQHGFHTYLPNTGRAPLSNELRLISTTPAGGHGGFSSLGYANVTLGRTLFARYAEERLAKRAVDRVLRGHLEVREEGRLVREEVMIEEVAAAARGLFFEESGLYELSSQHNQVIDFLRDPVQRKAELDGFREKLLQKLGQGSREARGEKWRDTVRSAYGASAQSFGAEVTGEASTRAQAWAPHVQQRLLDATARSIGLRGIPVTLALLDQLAEQVRDAAAELDRAKETFDKEEREELGKAFGVFEGLLGSKLMSAHPVFQKAAGFLREALARRTEASVYELAGRLLEEAHRNLLPPLRQTLEAAQSDLLTHERSEDFREEVAQWSEREFPNHLRPAPNEFLLEPEDKYPKLLDELLAASFALRGEQAGESPALGEVISGAWHSKLAAEADVQDKVPHQTLIRTGQDWYPEESVARRPTDPPSRPTFRLNLTPDELLVRARGWVTSSRTPVAEHVDETLGHWLGASGAGSAARATQFADAFKRAVGCAEPLVAVSTKSHRAVHDDAPPVSKTIVGEIPISSDHGAYKRVVEVLAEAGMEPGQIESHFNPNSTAAEIEISSFLGWTVHPMVMDSLTVPIQEDWQARGNGSDDERGEFWAFRRSRLLPAFVPLARSRQEALVRGWFTATALGYVGVFPDGVRWSDAPLSVWTPGGELVFPRFLLGTEPVKHASVLPALMESLPLAFVSHSAGHGDELGSYLRLIALGMAPSAQGAAYELPHEELAAWIASGEPAGAEPGAPPAPTPPPECAGTEDDSPEARRDAMVAWVTEYHDRFAAEVDGFRVTPDTTLVAPRAWELREVILSALRTLGEALKRTPLATAESSRTPVGGLMSD